MIPGAEYDSSRNDHNNNPERHIAQTDRTLAEWEYGLDAEGRIVLEQEDQTSAPEWWQDSSTNRSHLTRPEYATAPKSRADEVAEQLHGLSDRELHAIIGAHTKSVNQLRHLNQQAS